MIFLIYWIILLFIFVGWWCLFEVVDSVLVIENRCIEVGVNIVNWVLLWEKVILWIVVYVKF